MVGRIKPAEPINNRLLIAIAGPQASGKTTSALRLATGITQQSGGKICFIDTENKRALQYASAFKFNHMELDPPFSPERYDEAVKYAEGAGYGEGDVIIIDSMSHEHEGPGGVLEIHDEYMKSKNYNQKFNMLGWNHAKKGRKRFISFSLQRTPCHIILCFRAKQGLKEVQVNGKTQYVNTGLEPIGADEYFYEMNISLILPQGSMGKPDWSEKSSRINEFGGDMPITKLLHNSGQISEEMGYRLAELSCAKYEPSEETIVKSKAQTVMNALKLAETADQVNNVWAAHADEIGFIESKNQTTFLFLERQRSLRKQALDGAQEQSSTPQQVSMICQSCSGSGEVPDGSGEFMMCPECGGKE